MGASEDRSRAGPAGAALVAGVLLVGAALAGAPAAAARAAGPDDLALSSPRVDPYYPAKGDPSVDALHYGLRLHWSAGSHVLRGVARIRFRAPVAESQVRLDLARPLHVRAVRVDGHTVSYAHPGDDLVVDTGALTADSRHTLVVSYRGRPRPVAAPSTRTDVQTVGWTTTKRGEVWTMQEPFGAFTWYPVDDQPADKALYDARISAPRGMVGVFNGRLAGRRTSHGRTVTRWHLASPASAYLVTVAIGDYVRYRDRGPHGLPLTYWLPRGDQRALPELRRTPSMVRWLEARLGPYPFDRLGAVVVPSPSAMETQTLVTMGSRLISDRALFRSDLLHEYAHQWYGDTVTPTTWPDLWLNESFAMYTQLRWEVSRGWATQTDVHDYLVARDPGLRTHDGPPGAYHRLQFGGSCVYLCGALMLDTLRGRLGAATFDQLWRDWPQEHRFASVGRDDYVAWLNARTGQDWGPFVTSWLTSPTTPT
jgi:aminopeptidase N